MFFAEILFVYVVRIMWRLANLLRSRRWTKANATVLGCHRNKSAYESVSVDYEYELDSQKRVGTFLKPFIWTSSAELYADEHPPGAAFKIRSNLQTLQSPLQIPALRIGHYGGVST